MTVTERLIAHSCQFHETLRTSGRKSILVVFGTRPEAVKLAPVITALRDRPGLSVTVCVTAQHRQMLDSVLATFGIMPDVDLDLMQPGQSLEILTATAVSELTAVVASNKPCVVLVQGDTTTTFCAALAAFYNRVMVGHIEAGLRTADKQRPFPEEINRRLTTQIADLHFAPTEESKSNLLREGISPSTIYVTGNTVVDALQRIVRQQESGNQRDAWIERFKADGIDFSHPLILVTTHRREAFGRGIENICLAIRDLALRQQSAQVIFPVHLNPNVQGPVHRILGDLLNVVLLKPLSYEDFVFCMSAVTLIITDSGGVQEEAPCLHKPVLVVRETTERPEGVRAGLVRLVGLDRTRIVQEASSLLNGTASWYQPHAPCPYGDGYASQRIADICQRVVQSAPAAAVGNKYA